MLEWLYYIVTGILWCWHKVFGFVFGETQAITWVLGIIFLTFTIRAILFKPFVHQVRSMKKMQDFAPEIKKIQKRYANDRQRQAAEMQKLQKEHGVNPLGGCLPILIQIPVFIGLNHVLRAFAIHADRGVGNYAFSAEGARQYMDADLFGSDLGQAIYNTAVGGIGAVADVGFHPAALPVAIPLMILGSVLTHLTARHSVDRQNPASATQQTAMMNKITLWVFPIGLLAFGGFLPIGLLLYFLANNLWTLMQQRVVYRRIDREEEQKQAAAVEKRTNLGPKPGQKPAEKKRPAGPKPGQKPSQGKSAGKPGQSNPGASTPRKPGEKAIDRTGKGKARGTQKARQSAGEQSDSSGNGKDQPKTDSSGNANGAAKKGPSQQGDSDVSGVIYDASKKKSGRKRS